MDARIPKVIHYCWFGGKEKPEIVRRCMETWARVLPDYEIKEWNESNFDVFSIPYTRDAYEAGKFAFVSDYARVHALYHVGGIYLDTDVEVYKPFDDLLHHESFWGFEQADYIATSTIGSQQGHPLIGEFVKSYETLSFLRPDGSFNELTNVAMISKLLAARGLRLDGTQQALDGIGVIYPQPYFSPYDYINCVKHITSDTYAMHLFHKSWMPLSVRIKGGLKKAAAKVVGGKNMVRLRKLMSKV